MAEKIIIAAVAKNNVIGNKGKLPWDLPEDLKRFKDLTMGHAVFMGRDTFMSLHKPLEGRLNVVLTHHLFPRTKNVRPMPSLPMAIKWYERDHDKIYIAGGAKVYAEAIRLVDSIELTRIHKDYEGDTYFPKIPTHFKEVWREDHNEFSFIRYEKAI